jgi:hypothetical protein
MVVRAETLPPPLRVASGEGRAGIVVRAETLPPPLLAPRRDASITRPEEGADRRHTQLYVEDRRRPRTRDKATHIGATPIRENTWLRKKQC